MDLKWLESFLECPDFQGMGHGQSQNDLNLGLGWVYYGLCRALRPARIVCIGSYRGFVPIIFAKALKDNQGEGRVDFIDPSFVDDFWKDPVTVQAHFSHYGLDNIEHHCLTTQQFCLTDKYKDLNAIDFLFVDGFHSAAQAKFDHHTFLPKLSSKHFVFFHDSLSDGISSIYGEDNRYQYSVFEYIDELKASGDYRMLDLDIENGLSIVQSII